MILKRKILFVVLVCFAAFVLSNAETQESLGNFKNPIAVQEVLAGKRTTANAAWWGFDKNDSTKA